MKKNILTFIILFFTSGCDNSKIYYMKSDDASVYRGTAGIGGGVKRRLGEAVGKTFKGMPAPFDLEAEMDGKKYRRFTEEGNDGVCKWIASEDLTETPEKIGDYNGLYYGLRPYEKVRNYSFQFQNDLSFLLYSKDEAVLFNNRGSLGPLLMKGKYEVSGNILTIKVNELHKKNKTVSGLSILPSRDLFSVVNTIQIKCTIENQKLTFCNFYDCQHFYQLNKEYRISDSRLDRCIKGYDESRIKDKSMDDYKIYKADHIFMFTSYK